MKKHWTKYLAEAGRPIESLGNYQERRLQEIADLQKQIRQIRKEYAEEEKNIEQIVLNPDPSKGWTLEQVAAAKRGMMRFDDGVEINPNEQ